MMKNFYKVKFYLAFLPLFLFIGCAEAIPLEVKCIQDVDGNDWSPPRIVETKCFSNVRNDQYCPIYLELRENHTAYLIDTTDGPSKQFAEKLDILFSNETEFVNRNKPYTRISIVELNDKQSVTGFKPLGTICRPRSGTITPWKADQAHGSEGALAIQSDFTNKFLSPIQGVKANLSESTKANRTLIIEHINSLVNQPVYQFTGEGYKNRRLVILSDLLQWSDRFKLVRECKRKPKGCSSFESFYQQTSQNNRSYLDQMKPKLDEYSRVEIHHIQNKAVRDSKIEDQLKNFWIGFFEWAGVPGENIDYYLLPDSQ